MTLSTLPNPLATVRLHQLEGFFHVGLHQGFTRAAHEFPYAITEPALHQQVRKLERSLGVRLLEKGPKRRMLLTPAGRVLHEFISPYFERLPQVLRGIMDGDAGELVLGTEPLYAESLGAEVLARVQRHMPGARVKLLEADVPSIHEGLLRGTLDVGLTSLTAALPYGLRGEVLGQLSMELLVPARHPLAKRKAPLDAKHLAGHRYVVYERGTEGRTYTENALNAVGIELVVAAEATSAAAMRSLVRCEVGPAFVPTLGTKRPKRRKQSDGTISFDLTPLARQLTGLVPEFGLVTRAGAPERGLLARFLAGARAAVAD
jgi:LysR family cyn operon transcriptional activator